MIERTTDLARVNELLNRDFPGTDFAEVMAEPMHVVLTSGESGAAFLFRGPGIYEVHLFFKVRGRAALSLCQAMLSYMRDYHEARMFWALIPIESRKVQMFARLMGFSSLGPRRTRHGWNELFVSENEECPQR